MMRYKIIGFSILFLSSIAFATEKETKEAAKTWDDYKIIAERNIFSRYRTKAVQFSVVQQQVEVVPEESYFTLRGVTKESDGYVSFIEDSRTKGITRFRQGDSIAEGKIASITLDYLYYENESKKLKVEIGMNFEGEVVSSGMQYLSSGFGSSQAQENSRVTTMDQPQGMGQFPGMGQIQGMGQMPGMDQSQGGRGQMPGMGQPQSNGQSAAIGQTQVMGQSRSAGQKSSTVDQTSAEQTQSITATQQDASSDDIIQLLKERRKRELGE